MHTPRIPFFLLRCLQTLLFVGFALYAVAFLVHSFEVVTYPWSVDYVEAPELNRAARIAHGKDIYTSWDTSPFLESNYTPFFSVINAFPRERRLQGQANAWITDYLEDERIQIARIRIAKAQGDTLTEPAPAKRGINGPAVVSR